MRTAAIACMFLAVGVPVAAQDWTATVLTPSGYQSAAVNAVTPSAQWGYSMLGLEQIAMGWNGTAASGFSINPTPGWSTVYAADPMTQVGTANFRASLWHGTPQSHANLHPPGFEISVATAFAGPNQFGYVQTAWGEAPNAAMWSGNAASFVNLTPPGALGSRIDAADENQQGGYVFDLPMSSYAALWSGSPSGVVNLHPSSAYLSSQIHGMHSGQQVGSATVAQHTPHAILWTGTASSFVDLHPAGESSSELFATVGTAQVGRVGFVGSTHAGVWFGTAASFQDLNSVLPPGYFNSTATSIATDGSFYYIGGHAQSPSNHTQGILWVAPVPAPGAGALLLVASLAAARRRRATS